MKHYTSYCCRIFRSLSLNPEDKNLSPLGFFILNRYQDQFQMQGKQDSHLIITQELGATGTLTTELGNHLLDKRQLADYLGVSVYSIDSWVSQRRLPFVKLGKCVRFVPDEIAEWIEEQRIRPATVPFQVKNLDKAVRMD